MTQKVEIDSPFWFPSSLQFEVAAEKEDFGALYKLAQYWWAWVILEERWPASKDAAIVYDVGCGSGYGCRVMSVNHKDNIAIHGWDVSSDALRIANELHQNCINYRRVNLDVEFARFAKDKEVDLVTCFDAFEQLRHRDWFLQQLVRMMNDKGIFLVTIRDPNGLPTTTLTSCPWEIKYSLDDAKNLLERYFDEVCVASYPGFPSATYFKTLDAKYDFPTTFSCRTLACIGPRRS